MGNTPNSNLYSKTIAEKTKSDFEGKNYIPIRYIGVVKNIPSPSLYRDSLKLMGITVKEKSNVLLFQSPDWEKCKKFIIDGFMHDELSDNRSLETIKSNLSIHIDTYGWVERDLCRGEIILAKTFVIKIFCDCVETDQSCGYTLPPFNFNDDRNTIRTRYIDNISTIPSSERFNPLKDLLLKEETFEQIMEGNNIKGILADQSIYYNVTINFLQ